MKNIFKKNNEDAKEKKETDRTLIFYGIVFILILVLAISSKIFNNNEPKKVNNTPIEEEKEETENEIIDLVKPLENNNFDMELSIITNNDILSVIIRRENINKELVSVSYRDEVKNYYRNNYDIYLIEEEKYALTNNVKFYNDFDDTFINIVNILKLINVSKDAIDLKEEEYDIKRYKIDIEEVLKIYNNYKGAKISKKYSGNISLDINYKDEKLIGISINLTLFYKNLDKDYRNIEYNFIFDNIANADISGISEVIDKNLN